MRKIINRLIKPFGFSVEKLRKLEYVKNPLLENVFNTDFEKKVLFSYITGPFINKLNVEHTNLLECYTAAEIFKSLGYNVDVINFNQVSEAIVFSDYSIVYGLGDSFTQALSHTPRGALPKTILYGTCVSSTYAREATYKKIQDFYDRTGIRMLNSSRYSNVTVEQVMLSDQIIVLGNEFTLNTYLADGANESTTRLNAFYYDTYDIDLNKKNFDSAKNHVLWFGSSGLLHKGLDLAIDAIKEFPNLTLHICGANKDEKEFFSYYNKELNNKVPNIINYNFIKMNKPEFRKLMDTCGGVLFPSLSEGGSPSLLNVMANGGLLPITSAASGLDIEKFGITIKELTLDGVIESLKAYSALLASELELKSKQIKQSIRQNYSYDIYRKTLREYIEKILNK